MASPQKENGYTPIANELLEALAKLKISGSEWSIIMCLIRKTYGYNKKEDWITGTQIALATGLNRVRVSEAKTRLVEAGIVTEKRNKLSLNKDYEQWKKLRKSVTNKSQIVTEKRNQVLRKSVHTKDNITKDISSGDKSPPLKVKNTAMAFNAHADDFEEGVVDFDTGELSDPVAEKKVTDKKLNARMDELVDGLIASQQRDPVRTSRPKQKKAIKELVKMQVTGDEAKKIIREQMESDYWKGRKEKPDFFTVVALVHKRGE